MSPEYVVVVPVTTWDEIASPPPVMSLQPAPRLPFARLKLSETDPAAEARCGIMSTGAISAPSTRAPRAKALRKRSRNECDLAVSIVNGPSFPLGLDGRSSDTRDPLDG